MRFETTIHIGPDGTAVVRAPSNFANSDARLILERPNGDAGASRPKTREEWRRFLDAVAGSIDDPTFERPPQLEFRDRKLFD
jgi:hypothetical protein